MRRCDLILSQFYYCSRTTVSTRNMFVMCFVEGELLLGIVERGISSSNEANM